MQGKVRVWSAVVAGLLGLFAPKAEAQEAQAEQSLSVSTANEARADDADPKRKRPMGWAGIGLKLGAGGTGASEIDVAMPSVGGMAVPGVTAKTDSRAGFQLSVPINLGGDGFGWMVEPYLNLDKNITATGLYTGPTINIHILDPFYLGIGFGVKFAYLSSDKLDLGLDVGGRVPITGTYYIHPDIGLVAELGLGYTASGYAFKPLPGQESPDLSFGAAFAWDFSVGARWP
jgi:hypothetical protein